MGSKSSSQANTTQTTNVTNQYLTATAAAKGSVALSLWNNSAPVNVLTQSVDAEVIGAAVSAMERAYAQYAGSSLMQQAAYVDAVYQQTNNALTASAAAQADAMETVRQSSLLVNNIATDVIDGAKQAYTDAAEKIADAYSESGRQQIEMQASAAELVDQQTEQMASLIGELQRGDQQDAARLSYAVITMAGVVIVAVAFAMRAR